jgi:hypothetical protein
VSCGCLEEPETFEYSPPSTAGHCATRSPAPPPLAGEEHAYDGEK